MLVAAALVPDTALLVPGASARAQVLVEERAAVESSVAALVGSGVDRLVVLVPGGVQVAAQPIDALRPTLTAAGVPDARTGLGGGPGGVPVEDVPGAVGLWLLGRAGWTGEVSVVGAADRAAAAQALSTAAEDLSRTGVLLLGSASARHGEQAALAPELDGPEVDDALVRWLGGGPEPERARLERHAVSAAGPVRVLLDAAGGALELTTLSRFAPHGVTYLLASWRSGGAR